MSIQDRWLEAQLLTSKEPCSERGLCAAAVLITTNVLQIHRRPILELHFQNSSICFILQAHLRCCLVAGALPEVQPSQAINTGPPLFSDLFTVFSAPLCAPQESPLMLCAPNRGICFNLRRWAEVYHMEFKVKMKCDMMVKNDYNSRLFVVIS